MLEILTFIQGPVQTNTYLIADPEHRDAIVIDPAWDGESLVRKANEHGWAIRQIWLTHAHFDHTSGASGLVQRLQPGPPIALHPDDLPLLKLGGGAALFGFQIEPCPPPTNTLEHGQILNVGNYYFEVRHAPGHTPGHVVYYCSQVGVVFCGDVIFAGSIGRTDLPGSNYSQLIRSIRAQILGLPGETRLLSGHGPETTVHEERQSNPFLTGEDF